MTDINDLANCMMVICDPKTAENPIAWHELHKAGMTVDVLKSVSNSGEWMGPKPRFDMAPDPNGRMWQHLEAKGQTHD